MYNSWRGLHDYLKKNKCAICLRLCWNEIDYFRVRFGFKLCVICVLRHGHQKGGTLMSQTSRTLYSESHLQQKFQQTWTNTNGDNLYTMLWHMLTTKKIIIGRDRAHCILWPFLHWYLLLPTNHLLVKIISMVPVDSLYRSERPPNKEILRYFIRHNSLRLGTGENAPWVVEDELVKKYTLPSKFSDFLLDPHKVSKQRPTTIIVFTSVLGC